MKTFGGCCEQHVQSSALGEARRRLLLVTVLGAFVNNHGVGDILDSGIHFLLIICIDSFLVCLLIPGPRMSWETGRAHSELFRKQQLVLVPLVHPLPRTLYSSSPHSLITFHHIFQIQQFIFNNETRVRGAGFTAALVWRNRFSSFGFPFLQVARRSKQRFLATTQPQP